MKVNKFNIHWQIVRVKARKLKTATEKIDLVLEFFKQNNNIYNYTRVLNWLEMAKLGYSTNKNVQSEFDSAIEYLKQTGWFKYCGDNDNNLKNISTQDLNLVYSDLKKRNYNFQFKKVPQDHIEFIEKLQTELETR